MKHLFLAIGLLITATTFGQKDVVSAYNAKEDGNLRAAATYIEQAILVVSTYKAKQQEKTWRYRGEIYLKIASDTSVYAEFPNALHLAMESLIKAKDLDTKKRYQDESNILLAEVQRLAGNKGISSYNQNEFEIAGEFFDLAIDIAKSFDIIDSVFIHYSALSYKNVGLNDKAIERFKKCAEIQYALPYCYLDISRIYESNGDMSNAIAILREARDKHPDEISYIEEEYNIHIKNNDEESALACIVDATLKNPTNYEYIVLSGNLYQMLGYSEEAKNAFSTALALDSISFGANFGLGIIYNNEAALDQEKFNSFPLKLNSSQRKERSELKIRIDENIKMAILYFESAYKVNPTDFETVRILKDLYAKTMQDDKYLEFKAVFDSLKTSN